MTLTVPTPHTFATKEFATAANLNTLSSSASWMLLNRPEFYLWLSTGGVTVASGAESTIHFDTVQYDNQGGWGGVNNPVYAIPAAGKYSFVAQVEFFPTNNTGSREVTIRSGATGVIGKARVPCSPGAATTVNVAVLGFVTGPGDSIYVQTNQDAGVPVGVDSGIGLTFFQGRWEQG